MSNDGVLGLNFLRDTYIGMMRRASTGDELEAVYEMVNRVMNDMEMGVEREAEVMREYRDLALKFALRN